MKLTITTGANVSVAKYVETTGVGRAMMRYAHKGYYIHFGKTPKVGVSTVHAHTDPHGVYFYKLDWLIDNAKFDQYALTYPYYSIVAIKKSTKGITLQDFTEKIWHNFVLGLTYWIFIRIGCKNE